MMTSDGVAQISIDYNDSISILYVSGSLGGGSLTVGYKEAGTYIPLVDGEGAAIAMEVGNQYEIRHGRSMDLFVELTGATAPTVVVTSKGLV